MKSLKTAKEMISAGVEAADPVKLVESCVEKKEGLLRICGDEYPLDDHDELLLLGIGKASPWMAEGLKEIPFDDGLIITTEKEAMPDLPFQVLTASHPYPTEENVEVTEELLTMLDSAEDPLIIFLISGGGSSLFLAPPEGISLQDMKELNQLLVRSGADIKQMNAVRKHVSQVKGGRFGRRCAEKGEIVSLVLSDVVGDDLSSIASGPMYPDGTTYEEAVDVLKDFGLWKKIPKSIKTHLKKGMSGKTDETPSQVDADNFLVGNNLTALKGAKRVAVKRGYKPLILTSQNTGEAREVSKPYCGIAREVQDSGNPVETPAALIIGGEMMVSLDLEDTKMSKQGGPNREFVLSSAIQMRDRRNIIIASADSDGTDGVGKGGAVISTDTIQKSDLNPEKYLREHDTQSFFDKLDRSLDFESRTNVNDISVILVGNKPGEREQLDH